jgi:hypothetical protein
VVPDLRNVKKPLELNRESLAGLRDRNLLDSLLLGLQLGKRLGLFLQRIRRNLTRIGRNMTAYFRALSGKVQIIVPQIPLRHVNLCHRNDGSVPAFQVMYPRPVL